MGFKRNKVKVDLCSYPPYLFMAPRKFGKTTFWYELVKEVWGDDENGLLISFGKEEGYHALDGIQVETAKEWNAEYDEETELRGFVQIVDDLVENREEYGIKGVCLDTLDTMVDVATPEVLRLSKKETGVACKSLNAAFGGYGRGTTRLLDLMNEQIERLRDAGYAVFILCHIKMKERTDLQSGEKYETITNNLPDNVFTNIADGAQMVMVGMLDREISAGKIMSEERVVYLRGNSQVDAGSRFDSLPEKIELSPKAFMKAFEEGVKGAMKSGTPNDTEIKKMADAEAKARNKKAAKAAEIEQEKKKCDVEQNEEYIAYIKNNFTDAEQSVKDKVKEIMADYGIANFRDVEVSTEGLQKIVALLSA